MRLPAICQKCGRRGMHNGAAKPRWCRCPKVGGPYVAPPGFVAVITFESPCDAAFRERCRLLGNAEREARDALSERWVRCGRGWRELGWSSPKRRRLERAYRKALRALEAVQAQCAHDELDRSIFDRGMCGVCYAHVVSDIEQHRHLVREGIVAA